MQTITSSKQRLAQAAAHHRRSVIGGALEAWAAWSVGARELRVSKALKEERGGVKRQRTRRSDMRLEATRRSDLKPEVGTDG